MIFCNTKADMQLTVISRMSVFIKNAIMATITTTILPTQWCISSGNYSLCQHAQTMMPLFLEGLCR